jgi:hypothetical protein
MSNDFFSPLQRTLAMRQGLKSLGAFELKLTPMLPACQKLDFWEISFRIGQEF